jgi:hypothetical protein
LLQKGGTGKIKLSADARVTDEGEGGISSPAVPEV